MVKTHIITNHVSENNLALKRSTSPQNFHAQCIQKGFRVLVLSHCHSLLEHLKAFVPTRVNRRGAEKCLIM